MKNYCLTHHYYYEGVTCPFCVQEKFVKIAQRIQKEKEGEVEKLTMGSKKDDVITEELLSKLKEKFSH